MMSCINQLFDWLNHCYYQVHSKQYATMPKKDTEDRETALDHELAEVILDRQPNRNDHDDETELVSKTVLFDWLLMLTSNF